MQQDQIARIFAPYQANDVELRETIRDLRAEGQIIIQQLPGQIGSAKDHGCNAILEKADNHWVIVNLA